MNLLNKISNPKMSNRNMSNRNMSNPKMSNYGKLGAVIVLALSVFACSGGSDSGSGSGTPTPATAPTTALNNATAAVSGESDAVGQAGASISNLQASVTHYGDAPFDVTITFSADVALNGSPADILGMIDTSVTNASVSNVVSVDSAGENPNAVFTNTSFVRFTVTPDASGNAIVINIPAGIFVDSNDSAEVPASDASFQLSIPLSAAQVVPSVRLIGAPPHYVSVAGDTSTFSMTAIFSESVTGFEIGDIMISANAKIMAVTPSEGGAEYRITIDPLGSTDPSTAGGAIVLSIPANVATNGVGDGADNNTASTVITITEVLNAWLSGGPATHNGSDSFSVTARFNRGIDNFQNTVVTVGGNASVSVDTNPTAEPSERDMTRLIRVTPTGTGDITLSLPAGVVRAKIGPAAMNRASNEITITYDAATVVPPKRPQEPTGVKPTVIISEPVSPTYTTLDPIELTATFSERVTGFGYGHTASALYRDRNLDVYVSSGTITQWYRDRDLDLYRPNATVEITPVIGTGGTGGTEYTLTVTPLSVCEDDIRLRIPGNHAQAVGGYHNEESNMITIDRDTTACLLALGAGDSIQYRRNGRDLILTKGPTTQTTIEFWNIFPATNPIRQLLLKDLGSGTFNWGLGTAGSDTGVFAPFDTNTPDYALDQLPMP